MTSRWWIDQRERFPVAANWARMLVGSSSAVALSALLRGAWPSAAALAVAFVSAVLFAFELSVADEFKAAENVRRHRLPRPLPHGLGTLQELTRLAFAAVMLQMLLALWLDPHLIAVLLVVWIYMTLMARDFYAPQWFKAQPFISLCAHALVVPLIDLYATACDWMPMAGSWPAGLGWFPAASFFTGIVVEIGPTLGTPADEEPRVETIRAAWSRPRTLATFTMALVLAAVSATLAGRAVGVQWQVAAVGATAIAAVAMLGPRFLSDPAPGSGRRFEILAGAWTLAMYLSVGILPLALR
jgi:hypothetical protein